MISLRRINDPVIDRIREARHRISEECGHDPDKLVAYYIQRQNKHKKELSGNTEETGSLLLIPESGLRVSET